MACGCGNKNKGNSGTSAGSNDFQFLNEARDFFPGDEKLSLIDAIQLVSGLATIVLLLITLKKA